MVRYFCIFVTGLAGKPEGKNQKLKEVNMFVKSFKGVLPSDKFYLMEDEDFLVLFFQDKEVARFTRAADPQEVERTAEEYQRSHI